MASITKTETFHAVGYDATLSHFNAITNPNNFVGEATTDTLYVKYNGSIIPVEKVYKKINGSMVEQDITTAFDSNTNYVRG